MGGSAGPDQTALGAGSIGTAAFGLQFAPPSLSGLGWLESAPMLYLLVGAIAWSFALYTVYLWRVHRASALVGRDASTSSGVTGSSSADLGPGKEN
jgi:hypothetical protein